MIEALAGAFLLGAAVVALGAAALRVASLAAPGGLVRVVAAAPLAVAAAVAWALLCGVVGLGGNALALALGSLVAFGLARWRVGRPAVALSGEIAAWLRRAPLALRLAGAAALGLLAAWVVWALRFPYLGLDGSTYHLGTVAEWVISGDTGRSEYLYARIPVGSYPLTNEAAVAWGVGIAGSFSFVALWTPFVGALLLCGSWLGLRVAGVPRGLCVLALAALCLVPVVLRGLVHLETDVPAVAWLAVAAGLVACAVGGGGGPAPAAGSSPPPAARAPRPALLAPALVAAFLAVGTKTTVLPLALVVVGLGAWSARASLRRLALPLALACALGLVAGGLWYVRNLIAHGSPLWPFRATPWGDPVPSLLDAVDFSLLQRPRATLEGQLPFYRAAISGGLVLLGAGLLAFAWSRGRRRLAGAASGATLVALLAWASAPYTGAGAAPFLQVNTIRYLIPAMAAGAAALALSGRGGPRVQQWVALLLAASAAWSLKNYLDAGYLPAEGLLVGGAVGGTALAFGASFVAVRARAARLAGAAAALALVLAVGVGGRHYVERHARAGDFDSGVVTWFAGQAAWRDGDAPIAFSPTPVAPLAGNRLSHRLSVVGAAEPCEAVRGRLTRGWVVVRDVDRSLFGELAAERCLAGVRPVYDDGVHRVYGGG